MIRDFLALFFPSYCESCNASLFKHEEVVCTHCLYKLPKSIASIETKKTEKLLWSDHPVNEVIVLYYFQKSTTVQQLLHKLKYKNKTNIGVFMGKQLALEIKKTPALSDIDYIIPVPLHPKKLKKRGYNQSTLIAKGIHENLKIPYTENELKRVKQTSTQTSKSIYDRWENVLNAFELNNAKKFENKHVLLIDDVITTGSTIKACLQTFSENTNVKISIGVIAQA